MAKKYEQENEYELFVVGKKLMILSYTPVIPAQAGIQKNW